MDISKSLKELIDENPKIIKDYRLIGIFGSSLKGKKFNDIDLISIGNDKNHEKVIRLICKKLNKKVKTFKTIKYKPQVNKKIILIHDLHYSSIKDLLKKEWKDVINEIRLSCYVLYGSKKEIHVIQLTEKDFYELWLKWCEKIRSYEEFKNFKDYIIRIIPHLYKRHPELKLKKVCKEIIIILKTKKDWTIQKKDIQKSLSKNL